jgi:hypothetical protein
MPRRPSSSFDSADESSVRESSVREGTGSRKKEDPARARSKELMKKKQLHDGQVSPTKRRSFDNHAGGKAASRYKTGAEDSSEPRDEHATGHNKRRRSYNDKPEISTFDSGFVAPRRKSLAELSAEKKAALKKNMGGKPGAGLDDEGNVKKVKVDPRLRGSSTAKGTKRYENPNNTGEVKKAMKLKKPNGGGLVSGASWKNFVEMGKGFSKKKAAHAKVSPMEVQDAHMVERGGPNEDGTYEHEDFKKNRNPLKKSPTAEREAALDAEMNEGFSTAVIAVLIVAGIFAGIVFLLYLFLKDTEVGDSKFWIVLFAGLGMGGCFTHYYRAGYTVFEILGGRAKGGTG